MPQYNIALDAHEIKSLLGFLQCINFDKAKSDMLDGATATAIKTKLVDSIITIEGKTEIVNQYQNC